MSENAYTLAVLLLLCARLIVCSGQSSEPTSVSQIDNKSPVHEVPILNGGRSLLSETPEESSDSASQKSYQSTPDQFQDFQSNQNEEMQKIPTFVVRPPMSRFNALVPVRRSPLEIINNNSISFRNKSPNPMTSSRSSAQDNIALSSQFSSSKELANKIPIYVITPPAPGETLPALINMAVFPKETISPDIFRILRSLKFPPGSIPLVLLAAPIPAVALNVPNNIDSINTLDFVPPEENRQPLMDIIPQNMVSDETWYDEEMIKRYRILHGRNPSSSFPDELRRIPQQPNPSELLPGRKLPYNIESPVPYWIPSGSGNLHHLRPSKVEEISEPNEQRTPSEDKPSEIDVPIVYRDVLKYPPIPLNRILKYPITDRQESIYAPITLETVPADEISQHPQFPRSGYFPYPSSDDQVQKPLKIIWAPGRPIFDPSQPTNQTHNGYPIDNYSEFPASVERVPSTKRRPKVNSQMNRFAVPPAPPKPSSPEPYPYGTYTPDAEVLGYPIFNSDKPEFVAPQNYPRYSSEYNGDPVPHYDLQPQRIYPGSAPHLSPDSKLVPPQNYPKYPSEYNGDAVPQHDSQLQPIYPDSAPRYPVPQLPTRVEIGKLNIPNEPQIMPSYRYRNPDGRLPMQDYPGQQPNYHPHRQVNHPTHTRPNAPTRTNQPDSLNTLLFPSIKDHETSSPSTEQPEPVIHVNYPFVELPTIKEPRVESKIGRFIIPEIQNTITYPLDTPVYRQEPSGHVLKPHQPIPHRNDQYVTLPSSDVPNNYDHDGPRKPLNEFLPEYQMKNKPGPTNEPRPDVPLEFNQLTIPENNDKTQPQTYRITPSSGIQELRYPNSDSQNIYPQSPHEGKIPSFPELTSDGTWPRSDIIPQSPRPSGPWQEFPHRSPIDTDKRYPYVRVEQPQDQYTRSPSGLPIESYPRIPTDYTKRRPDDISNGERFEIPAQPQSDLQPEYPEPTPTDTDEQYSFPREVDAEEQHPDQYPRLPSGRQVEIYPRIPTDYSKLRPDVISNGERFEIPPQQQLEFQPEYPEPTPKNTGEQYSFPRVVVVEEQQPGQYPQLPSNRNVESNPTVPSDHIAPRPDIIPSGGRFEVRPQTQYEPQPEYSHPSQTDADKRYPYVKVRQPQNKYPQFPTGRQVESYPRVPTDYKKPRPDIISNGERYKIPAQLQSVPQPKYPYRSPLDTDEGYPYVRVEQPQDLYTRFPSGLPIESNPRIPTDSKRRPDVISNGERFEIPAKPQSDLQPEYPEPTPTDTDEQYSFPREVDAEEQQPDQYPRFPSSRPMESYPRIPTDYTKRRPDVTSNGERFEIPAQSQSELQPEYPEFTPTDTDGEYSFPRVIDAEEQQPDQYPRLPSGRQVKPKNYPRIPFDYAKRRPDIISNGERFEIPVQPQPELQPEYPEPTPTDKDEQYTFPRVVDVEEQQPDQYRRLPSNGPVVSHPTVTSDHIAPRRDVISSGERFEIPAQLHSTPQPEYPYRSPVDTDERHPYVRVEQPQDLYPRFPSGRQVESHPTVPFDYSKQRPDVISNGERIKIPPQPQLELQPEYLEPTPRGTDEQYSFPRVVDVEEQQPDQYPRLPSGRQVESDPRIPTDNTKQRPDVISNGERFEIPPQPQLELQPEYPATPRDTDEPYSFPRVVVVEEQRPDQYSRLPSNRHVESNPTVPSDHIAPRPAIISRGGRFEIPPQPQYELQPEYPHPYPTHADKRYPNVRVRPLQDKYPQFPSDGQVESYPRVPNDYTKRIPDFISNGERFDIPPQPQLDHQPEYPHPSPLVTDKRYPHISGLQPHQYPQFPSDRQFKGHPMVPTDNTLPRPDVISSGERFEIPAQIQTELQPEYSEHTPTDTDEQYSFPPDQYPRLPSNRHVESHPTVPSDHIPPRTEIISSGGRFEIPPQPQYELQPKYPHPYPTHADNRYPNVILRHPQEKYPQFPSDGQVESYPRVPTDYTKPRPDVISNGERFEIPEKLQLVSQPKYPHPSLSDTDKPYPHISSLQPQVQYPQVPSDRQDKGYPRVFTDNTLPRPDVISRGERFEIPALPQSDPGSEYPHPSPSDTHQHHPYVKYPTDFNEPRPDVILGVQRPVQTQPEPQPKYFQPSLRGTNEQLSFPRVGFKPPQDQYPQFPSDHLVAAYPRVPSYGTTPIIDDLKRFDAPVEPSSNPLKAYDEPVSFPDTDLQYPRADQHSRLPSDVQVLVNSEFPFDNTKPISDVTSGLNRLIIPEQPPSEPLPEYPYYSPEGTDEQYRYPRVGVQQPQNQYPQFPIESQVIDQPKVPSAKTEPRREVIPAAPSQPQSEPLPEYPTHSSPLETDELYRYPFIHAKQPQDQYSRFPSDQQVSGYPRVPSDDSKPRPDVASTAQIIYIPSQPHPQHPQPSRPYGNEPYYYPDNPIQLPHNVQHPLKDDHTQGYPASKLPVDGTKSRPDSINLPRQPQMYPHIAPKDTNEPYYNIDGGGHRFKQPLLKEHPPMPSDGQVPDYPVPYPTEDRPVSVISNVPIVQVQSNPEFQQEYPKSIQTTPSETEKVYNYPGIDLLQPHGNEYPSFDRQPTPNVDFNVQRVNIPQQPLSEPQGKFPTYDDDNGNEQPRLGSQEPNNDHQSQVQHPSYLNPNPHDKDSSVDARPDSVSEDQTPLLKYLSSDAPDITIIVPDRDHSQLPNLLQTTIPSEDLRTEYTIPNHFEQSPSYPGNWPPFPTDRLPAADDERPSLESDILSPPGRFKIPETHIRPQSEYPLFTPKDTYDQSYKPKPHQQQGSFPENPVRTVRPDQLFPQDTFPLSKLSSTKPAVERVEEFSVPNSSSRVSQPQYPTMDGKAPIQNPRFTLDKQTEYPPDDGTQIPERPIIRSDIGTFEITEAPIYYQQNPRYDSSSTEVPGSFRDRFPTQMYPSGQKPELSRPPFLPLQYPSKNQPIKDVRPVLPKSSSEPDNDQIQRFNIPDELTPRGEDYPVYPSTYTDDNMEIEEQNQTQLQYSSMGSHKPIRPFPKRMPVQQTIIPELETSPTDGKPLDDSQYPHPISRPLNYLHPYPIDDTVPEIDLFEVPEGQRLPGARPMTQYPSKRNEGPSPSQRPSAGVDIDTFTIPQQIPQPHGSVYPEYPLTDKEVPGYRYLHPRYPSKHTPKIQYPEDYPDRSWPRSLTYTEDLPVIEPKSITPNVHMNMDRMEVTEPSVQRYPSGVITPITPDEQLTIIPNEYYPDRNYPIDETVRHQPGYSVMFPYGESVRPEVSKYNELGDFPKSVDGAEKPTVFFYPKRGHTGILPIRPYSQLERSPVGSSLPSTSDSPSNREPDESQTLEYEQLYPERKSLGLNPFDLLSTPGRRDDFPKDPSRDYINQPQPSSESTSYLPQSERYPSLGTISKHSIVDKSEPILEEPLTTTRYTNSPHIYSTYSYPTPRLHPQPSDEYDPVTTSQAPPSDEQPEQPNAQDFLDTTILVPTSPIIELLPRPNIQQPAPQFPLASYDSSHPEIPSDQSANPAKPLQHGEDGPSEYIPSDNSSINSIDFPTSTDGTEKRHVHGSITRPSVSEKDENLTTTDKSIDRGTPLYESADELSTHPPQVMPAQVVLPENSPFPKLDDGGVSEGRSPSGGVTEIDPQLTTSVESRRFPLTPGPNLPPPGMTTPCSPTPISPDGRDGSALATSQNLRPCITDSPPQIPVDQPAVPDSKITRIFPVSKPTFYTDKDGQQFVNLKLLNEPIPTTTSQDVVLSEAPGSPQQPGMVDLVVPIVGDVIPNQEPNNLPSPSLLQNSSLPHPILKSIPIDKVQVFDAQTIIKVIESCDCTNLKFLLPILKRPQSAIVVANNEYPGIESHDSTKSDTFS